MRNLRTLAFTAIMGASLAACGGQGSGAMSAIDVDPKSVEAHVTKLVGETVKGKQTAAADVESLRAALPPEVALSWGNLSFDAASGSTVLTAVKLTPKDMPAVGIGIDELRLVDLDVDLLKARMAGQRLTETAPLARRIDAKGVSMFGLAAAINQFQGDAASAFPNTFPGDDGQTSPDQANPLKFQQPTDPTAPPADGPLASEPDDFDDFDDFSFEPAFSIDKYDISIGRIMLDDVMLKPYQVAAAPAAAAAAPDPYDPMSSLMPLLQQVSAIAQSYGVDTVAYQDMKASFAMTQYGAQVAGDIAVASVGARGIRGGDTDAMYMRGLNYQINDASSGMPMNMGYTLDLMTVEDFRLGKVFDYLAKGVVPPRTEKDLMSFGLWRSQNESMKMGGKQVYSVAESMFDATGWHWFIPTNLRGTGKNATIDVAAFMEVMQQQINAAQAQFGQDEYAAQQAAQMQEMMGLFSKHGLNQLKFNYDGGWNWNADNGAAKLDFGFDGENLLKINAKYEGGFPSFKAVSDLIPDNPENADPVALQNIFEANSNLKLLEINIEDKGGLPKIYGLVGDMTPAMTGGQPMTAENVRALAANGLKTMAAGASQQIPEVPALLNPVAAFLELGGKLRIAAQPSKPTPFSTLAGLTMGIGMGATSPSQAIKDLGLKTEHSK